MTAYRTGSENDRLQRCVEANNWLQARAGVIVVQDAMRHPRGSNREFSVEVGQILN
jgi:hypothetical protein